MDSRAGDIDIPGQGHAPHQVWARTQARFRSQALDAGTQVISVLLSLDAIAFELSTTCTINCFSHAIEIDHLVVEAGLMRGRAGGIWSSGTHPVTCPLEPPTPLSISAEGASAPSVGCSLLTGRGREMTCTGHFPPTPEALTGIASKAAGLGMLL